jgi:TetR/AcrR family transcriptional regulator, mexJK operon transcriptional repressor
LVILGFSKIVGSFGGLRQWLIAFPGAKVDPCRSVTTQGNKRKLIPQQFSRNDIRIYMGTTYESILTVSKRLFLERGFAATSMREIAAECGVAKATIYHHFMDKERILLALFEATKQGQEAMLIAIRSQVEPRLRIETALRENLRMLSGITGIIQAVRRELPGGRELVRGEFGPIMEEFRCLISEALIEGERTGLFRPIEPEKATRVLMAMIQGSVAAAMLGDGRINSPEAQAEAIIDVFFNGVLA